MRETKNKSLRWSILITFIFLMGLPSQGFALNKQNLKFRPFFQKGELTKPFNDYDNDIDETDPNGSIIWHGFRHNWKNTPHRLSRFGSYFRNIDTDFDDEEIEVSGERRHIFRVGELADTGTVKIKGQYISSENIGIHQGNVSESCLTVRGSLGYRKTVKCLVKLNLEDIEFEDYDEVTVLLRGFRLKEDSYKSGYNTRGFRIRLIPNNHSDTNYSFYAEFSVHPEHAPDRPLPKWFPLGDDCDNCHAFEYSAKIYYTVIGVNSDNGRVFNAPENGSNSYTQTFKAKPFKKPDWVSRSKREVTLLGDPGFNKYFAGYQGFEWKLNEWSKTRKDGRYIRDIQFSLANFDYDSSTGRLWLDTNMYFSNQGAWPEGFQASFKSWITLVQLKDRTFKKSGSKWYSGQLHKNETSIVKDVEHVFNN